MTAAWLVYGLLIGSLLAMCGAAVERLCRQHRLSTRWVWAACTAATLALLLNAFVGGFSAAAVLPATSGGDKVLLTTHATSTTGMFAGLSALLAAMTGLLRAGVIAVARLVPSRTGELALMGWIACSVAASAIVALVHLRMRRARRTWPAAMLHGQRVRIAPAVGPAVIGVLRPEIVVPQWLLRRTADEQRLVIAHETEHLRGRDHLLLGGATLAVVLLPWHPAVWWMLSRLRLAIELDCDARVLRDGVPARKYGEVLIDLAGQCAGFRVGATALADEASHLERRLLAMKPNPSRHIHLSAAVLFVAAGLSLLAACEARVPTAAEISAMDVTSAEHNMLQSKMMDERAMSHTTFYVNSARVTAREAHAITPNQIATVRVEKGQGDAASIYITTNGQAPEPENGAERSALKRLHYALHDAVRGPSSPTMLRTPGPDNQMMAGLIFLNGTRIDAAAFRKISPERIATVDIIKGAEATKLYSDPAAANGVIKITTK